MAQRLSLEERIAALEAKVDLLIDKVNQLEREINSKNNLLKYMVMMYLSTLSFIAALFGLGWKP